MIPFFTAPFSTIICLLPSLAGPLFSVAVQVREDLAVISENREVSCRSSGAPPDLPTALRAVSFAAPHTAECAVHVQWCRSSSVGSGETYRPGS